MLIVSVFLILAFLSYNNKSKVTDEIILFISLCFLSVILVYRASDFPLYYDYFKSVGPLYDVFFGRFNLFSIDQKNYEIGYKVINSFFKIFTNQIEVLYLFCNAFILFIVYKLFRIKSANTFKLLLPYFIFMLITVQVGIIRQMIAISIFLYSIQFIEKRDFIKFLGCTILAFLFHRTAIILPVLYLVAYKEYSNKILITILIVGIFIFLEIIPFSAIHIAEKLKEYITIESVHKKLNYYIWETKNLPIPPKLNRGIFENVGMFLLLLFIRNKLINKQLYDKFTNICLNLSLIYIVVYIYFFDISSFSYRINYYLIIFKFFVIVKYIESLEIKSNRIIANSVLVIYCAMMMIIRIGQGY